MFYATRVESGWIYDRKFAKAAIGGLRKPQILCIPRCENQIWKIGNLIIFTIRISLFYYNENNLSRGQKLCLWVICPGFKNVTESCIKLFETYLSQRLENRLNISVIGLSLIKNQGRPMQSRFTLAKKILPLERRRRKLCHPYAFDLPSALGNSMPPSIFLQLGPCWKYILDGWICVTSLFIWKFIYSFILFVFFKTRQTFFSFKIKKFYYESMEM